MSVANHFVDMSLGARIRQLRADAFSQRELADAAGVDVEVIRRLEQEVQHTAPIAGLQRIARALDVDLATLFGKRVRYPSSNPDQGVLAIRWALASVDDLLDEADEVAVDNRTDLAEARRMTDHAWTLYWAGRYEQLAALLPIALTQLRAAARAAPADNQAQAHELLARGYWVTGSVLVHFGHQDSAWLAIRESLRACERGSDPLLNAMVRGCIAWQLLRQGRYEESIGVALRSARAIEPSGDVALPHLSVYGYLLVTTSIAAGRAQRARQAHELLAESRAVAERIGIDRNDYQSAFGPSQVVMQTVNVRVVTDDYVNALNAAQMMPRAGAGLPVLARAQHLTDIAYAHTQLGHIQPGRDVLLAVEGMAPEWIRSHTLPRQVAAELVQRDRDPALRDLAARIGVAGH
jgi:transcriptional regulator with XRE-family HTH domain